METVGRYGGKAVGRAGVVLSALLLGCSHNPPRDFSPDPGLIQHIRAIRIATPSSVACPGDLIPARYYAELDSGGVVAFATEYDEDHPPRLHVMFLTRTSGAARPRDDGSWRASSDPLASALKGFNLSAFMSAKPSLNAAQSVAPEYSCVPHAFVFEGPHGYGQRSGGDGPDVVVRLGVVKSPYVDRLLVASIEVNREEPRYVLADMAKVEPADWLQIVALGGQGGDGDNGRRGAKGRDGAAGCPGAPGGAGGAGGSGGPGGPGGRGGRVTIYVPEGEPLLAGLVDARTPGGKGGDGGHAGSGGDGGKGGAASPANDRRCAAGADGAAGPSGRPGEDGPHGRPGGHAEIITLPDSIVFGPLARGELLELMRLTQGK
jgi:hypothetical protein